MSSSSQRTSTDMSLKDIEKGDDAPIGDRPLFHDYAATADSPQSTADEEEASQDQPNPASFQAAVVDNWPTDPENPFNWPMWQRAYHAIAPALLGFAVTFGTSVYTPAIGDIMRDLNVSREVALLGLTLYTFGLGIGPTITAPLSEGHGRKIVYLVSSPIFMLFTVGAGFSKTFYSLAICRFFAGIAGSPALAVGAGTNADVFPPKQRAIATSMFLVAPFAGPALGPIVGGFAAQYKTWEWTQWCLIFVTLAAYAISLPMKETFKPIILKKRAKKAGIEPSQVPAAQTPPAKSALLLKLVRPLHMLFTEPTVFFFSLYTSFAFGVLFIFFGAFPYIFMRAPYNFTTSQSGLTFLSIGIGVLIAAATALITDRFMYQPQYKKALETGRSMAAPEHRLYAAMIGGGGIVVGLFWCAWVLGTGQHWAAGLAGAIPFAWGNLCLFTSSALYMVDTYGPMNGASAMAANGMMRYSFGAVFPLFTFQMYDKLGIAWATSLLGFLALLMLPIPFVFFKYGAAIREKSKYPKIM